MATPAVNGDTIRLPPGIHAAPVSALTEQFTIQGPGAGPAIVLGR